MFLSLQNLISFPGWENEGNYSVEQEQEQSLNTWRSLVVEGPTPSGVPVENYSTFVLASKRTLRKDPLNGFKKYTKGWNLSDRHYWAVSLSNSHTPPMIKFCLFDFLLSLSLYYFIYFYFFTGVSYILHFGQALRFNCLLLLLRAFMILSVIIAFVFKPSRYNIGIYVIE